MIQGTEKIQELIRQASSLHIVNTIYFIAQVALVLFIYQLSANVSNSVSHGFLDKAGAILLCVFFLKIAMHHYRTLQGFILDAEFELILSCLNAVTTGLILYSLNFAPNSDSVVLLFESFLPIMLFVLVSPLTWNKSSGAYFGFYGFLEWSLLLTVIFWSGTTVLALYENGAYYALASNAVIMASPFLVRLMRKRHIDKLFRKMHEEIYTDPLTGIQNRKCFYDYYDRLRDDGKQGLLDEKKLVILFADIDYFKQYNDYYGHDEGDICLAHVAKILSEIANSLGIEAFRYGGEEFILCGAVSQSDIDVFLDNEVMTIWQDGNWLLDVEHENAPKKKLSLSAGLCFYSKDVIYKTNAAGITKVADKYLYIAKSEGRSKLVLAPESELTDDFD